MNYTFTSNERAEFEPAIKELISSTKAKIQDEAKDLKVSLLLILYGLYLKTFFSFTKGRKEQLHSIRLSFMSRQLLVLQNKVDKAKLELYQSSLEYMKAFEGFKGEV